MSPPQLLPARNTEIPHQRDQSVGRVNWYLAHLGVHQRPFKRAADSDFRYSSCCEFEAQAGHRRARLAFTAKQFCCSGSMRGLVARMRHFSARHGTVELLCLLPHEAVGPSSSCCSSILPENDAARKGMHQQQTQKNTAGRVLCTEILPGCLTSVLRCGSHATSWHASAWAAR